MRYLAFISTILFLGCASQYSHLQKTSGDPLCIQKFKPVFSSVLYKTEVNITGHYISGLMLFKIMPDTSIRIVFSNEMGFKFFDFGFIKDSGFRVYYVLKQMDKKVVLKTLRKDFELILFQHTPPADAIVLSKDSLRFYGFPQEKGINYYITNPDCTELIRLEKSSKRKPVVTAIMKNYTGSLPDTIGITHTKFNFTIGLKRINR